MELTYKQRKKKLSRAVRQQLAGNTLDISPHLLGRRRYKAQIQAKRAAEHQAAVRSFPRTPSLF